jgi:IclR family transcriptional regulator, acetate operon repressor
MSVQTSRGPAKTSGGVQSVDRAFELLELVAAADGGAGLSQLAAGSGLPVPTVHRIVRSLVASGHVLQLASRRYALGPRMVGLGKSAAVTLDAWAHPHLGRLAEVTGETANLAMLDRTSVVYLAQATSARHHVRMFTEVGSRVLPHCTGVGKALLAQLDPDLVRSIVTSVGMRACTPRTITDPVAFADELERVRELGYAVDDEEHERGVRCAAVAVEGMPATAISVSGPAGRLTRAALPRVVPVLVRTAQELADGLGGNAAR